MADHEGTRNLRATILNTYVLDRGIDHLALVVAIFTVPPRTQSRSPEDPPVHGLFRIGARDVFNVVPNPVAPNRARGGT